MLRRSAELMDRIETYSPLSEAELGDMIAFFVKRASFLNETGDGRRELDIAVGLMQRFGDAALPRGELPQAANDAGRISPGARRDPDDLAALVVHSRERLVAVGTDYRYLATSAPNAAFNRSTQIGMMGRHMIEIIGRARFEDRAKAALDRCFEDVAQDYVYALDVPRGGARLIRCRMDPVRDRSGRLYCALMRMNDVTDEMRKAS